MKVPVGWKVKGVRWRYARRRGRRAGEGPAEDDPLPRGHRTPPRTSPDSKRLPGVRTRRRRPPRAFIRAAQSIGRSLSLGEIREVHSVRDRGQAPCAHVASLIEEHARDLDERLRQLQKMQRELGRLSIVARSLPRASGKFCHIIELARPS